MAWSTAIATVLALESPALAEPHDAAAADALFRQAREAAKAGQFAVACPKFAESQRLDPAAGTLVNLAECEETLGLFASAAQHARDALDQLPPGDDRAPLARRVLSSVEKKVPRLVIAPSPGCPPGTIVKRDGVELGSDSLGRALPANPGRHEVIVSAPKHDDAHFVVILRAGETKQLAVNVGEPVSGPPLPGTTNIGPREAPSAREAGISPAGGKSTAGYVVGGIGLAAAVVGVVSLYESRAYKNASDDTYGQGNDGHLDYVAAQEWQTAAIVGLGLGSAAIVAGVVLVATSEPGASTSGAQFTLAPVFAARSGGLSIGGSW